MTYKIRLNKENFKFSVSHFTIFGPAVAERLHGHNYYVGCEIHASRLQPEIGLVVDFNDVKPALRAITLELDEYVLLPQGGSLLKIDQTGASTRVNFSGKEYQFPTGDVKLLPISNVTSEELARWIGEELLRRVPALKTNDALTLLSVSVEETRGQSVVWEVSL
jgi:6-pyruvoyltetrahydropterin/6-carboxytetrahydropterin synthase